MQTPAAAGTCTKQPVKQQLVPVHSQRASRAVREHVVSSVERRTALSRGAGR